MIVTRATPDMLEGLPVLLPIDERKWFDAAVLNRALAQSEITWVGLTIQGVVMLGGICRADADTGRVWQVGTRLIAEHKRDYLRESLVLMGKGLSLFPRLITVVRADYTAALRHCRRNGWIISAPQDFGGTRACLCERGR